MCKESLNCLLTEKCTNEESIRADERAKVFEELKPFLDKILQGDCDWICEDICGTVEEDGEDWCYWHCKGNTDMDCLKKWCEYMRNKEE